MPALVRHGQNGLDQGVQRPARVVQELAIVREELRHLLGLEGQREGQRDGNGMAQPRIEPSQGQLPLAELGLPQRPLAGNESTRLGWLRRTKLATTRRPWILGFPVCVLGSRRPGPKPQCAGGRGFRKWPCGFRKWPWGFRK